MKNTFSNDGCFVDYKDENSKTNRKSPIRLGKPNDMYEAIKVLRDQAQVCLDDARNIEVDSIDWWVHTYEAQAYADAALLIEATLIRMKQPNKKS